MPDSTEKTEDTTKLEEVVAVEPKEAEKPEIDQEADLIDMKSEETSPKSEPLIPIPVTPLIEEGPPPKDECPAAVAVTPPKEEPLVPPAKEEEPPVPPPPPPVAESAQPAVAEEVAPEDKPKEVPSRTSTEKKRQAPKAPTKEEIQIAAAKLETKSEEVATEKSPLALRNIRRVEEKSRQPKTGWL